MRDPWESFVEGSVVYLVLKKDPTGADCKRPDLITPILGLLGRFKPKSLVTYVEK